MRKGASREELDGDACAWEELDRLARLRRCEIAMARRKKGVPAPGLPGQAKA